MNEDGRWITTKSGNRVFIKNKDVNDYMNDKIRNSKKEIIEATHITKEENINNIKQNGFDLGKSGTGAGSTFGKGVYFTTNDNELLFYKSRLDSQSEIKADIDTRGFLTITYDTYTSRGNGGNNAWDIASKFLSNSEIQEYKNNIKLLKDTNKKIELGQISEKYSFDVKQDALLPILEKNYPGVIIKQNTPALDIITGGNQIVVYDTKRIKIKE